MTENAKCADCKRVMKPNGGCSFTHVANKNGKVMRRIFAGEEGWGTPCHDCNAGAGKPHHPGCDVERCPECGGQMLGCFGDPDDPEMLKLVEEFGDVLGPSCGWVTLQKVERVRAS